MENALDGRTSKIAMPMHNSQGRTTYGDKLENLNRLRKSVKEWSSPPILLTVAESMTSDQFIEIDVAETIVSPAEGGGYVPRENKRNDDNCYWLAKVFDTNDENYRKSEIIPAIKSACRGSGFKVNCHWVSNRNCIEVKCNRHKHFDEVKSMSHNKKYGGNVNGKGQPKEAKKKSEKPVIGDEDNDEICPVHWCLY